ncbi:hypothetical protein [Streptomyces sp. NPDC005890]|uniref:hypothetical protein n=1 Tax=Streptomyces sp. NPDC005890 TaxID=3154568 RepID=UPI0033D5B275
MDTRWVIWRRGVTVGTRFEEDPYSEGRYVVHFRLLDGQEVTTSSTLRGCRDEIEYDPQDPSPVIAPSRVAWLGVALAAFFLTGVWGVVFSIPAVLWLTKLVALLF